MDGRERLRIGFSTGWLCSRGIYSVPKQLAIAEIVGANAIELFVAGVDDRDNARRMQALRDGRMAMVGGYPAAYLSLHLPAFGGHDPERQLAMAREAFALWRPYVAVIHPLKIGGCGYPMKYYKRMIMAGFRLAVENMDREKDSGVHLADLRELVDAGCDFVLDVQHAFEHDPRMEYADRLLNTLKCGLVHLHVSGEAEGNNHSLLCRARNADTIIGFVRKVLRVKNVPLILEGEYADPGEIRQEIAFLKKELGY